MSGIDCMRYESWRVAIADLRQSSNSGHLLNIVLIQGLV